MSCSVGLFELGVNSAWYGISLLALVAFPIGWSGGSELAYLSHVLFIGRCGQEIILLISKGLNIEGLTEVFSVLLYVVELKTRNVVNGGRILAVNLML